MATTPERQQDPGAHGYGGTQQEKDDAGQEHPLEDPQAIRGRTTRTIGKTTMPR